MVLELNGNLLENICGCTVISHGQILYIRLTGVLSLFNWKRYVVTNQCKKYNNLYHKPRLSVQQFYKQLYICNKTQHLSYKGGCGILALRHLKEELA